MTTLKRSLFLGAFFLLALPPAPSHAVSTVKHQPPKVVFKGGGSTMQFNQGIMPRLVKVATKLRRQVMVTSGWRSVSYNRKIGGAKRSAHLTGNAVDIRQQSNPRGLAVQVNSTGLFSQVLWNSCRPHVHLAVDRSGHFDECGKIKGRQKPSKVKGQKKKPKNPKKRPRR
jgi:hypothetical protein